MRYVKLVAKPDTWFKEGTEAYSYECVKDNKVRITLEEYEDWLKYGYILCRGTRVAQNPNSEGKTYAMGEEYFDGENCDLEEFEISLVEKPY